MKIIKIKKIKKIYKNKNIQIKKRNRNERVKSGKN